MADLTPILYSPSFYDVKITFLITYGITALLLIFCITKFTVSKILAGKKKKKKNDAIPTTVMPSGSAVNIEIGKVHEQGAREEQQDSFGVSDMAVLREYGLLAVVADGMGGLSNGGKVSAAATRSVLDAFIMSQGTSAPKELLVSLLKNAVNEVNELLGEDNLRKSGSTLVMGYIRGNMLNFLSVGDSRISLFRNGILMQLNREHVYEDELLVRSVNNGTDVRDALNDPKGKGLVNYIGIGKIKTVDMPASPIRLYPGDKVLLMSDGVYNAITEDETVKALSGSAAEAAENIRKAVASKGYPDQDNYTAVVIDFNG